MKHSLITFVSLTLAALMSLSLLVGCTNGSSATTKSTETSSETNTKAPSETEKTPDFSDMKIAGSTAGVYTLRMPSDWSVYMSSPLAIISPDQKANVNITVTPNVDSYTSPNDYAKAAIPALKEIYGDMISMKSQTPSAAKLGGENAARVNMTISSDGVTLSMSQIYAIKGSNVYVMTLTLNDNSASATYNPVFDRIMEAFMFE